MDYSTYISDMAIKYGLRPDVLHRLVKNESAGRQSALSPKGAIGITQLMPGTAKELGVDPSDPYQNIEGGARYLRQNLDKFGGDYSQALAGYNTGPNRKAVVSKNWDMLPTETKRYVNKFMDLLITPASADETPYQVTKNVDEMPDIKPEKVVESDVLDLSDGTINGEAQTGPEPADELDLSNGTINGEGEAPKNYDLKDVPLAALKNAPGDLVDTAKGIYNLYDNAFGDGTLSTDSMGTQVGHALQAVGQPVIDIASSVAEAAQHPWESTKRMIAEHPVQTAMMVAPGGTVRVVGKGAELAAKGVGKVTGAEAFAKNALIDTTHEGAKKILRNVMGRNAGVSGVTSLREVADKSGMAATKAYKTLDAHAANTKATIRPEKSIVAAAELDALDNTTLNHLNRNQVAGEALRKIRNGEQLTAPEVATIHQQLSSVPAEGRAFGAVKQLKKALIADTKPAAPEFAQAIETANTAYARKTAAESLQNVVGKSIEVGVNGEDIINFAGLSTKLKNWETSRIGRQATKYNPGLAEDIHQLRKFSKSHPELKSLLKDTTQGPIIQGSTLSQAIKGLNAGGIAGGAIGLGVGGYPGAMLGATVGEAGQWLVTKPIKGLIKAGAKTNTAREMWARHLDKQFPIKLAKVPETVAMPRKSFLPAKPGQIIEAPKPWEQPEFNIQQLRMPEAPASMYEQKLLPAPNPTRTIKPGRIDKIGPDKIVSPVVEAPIVEAPKPVKKPMVKKEKPAKKKMVKKDKVATTPELPAVFDPNQNIADKLAKIKALREGRAVNEVKAPTGNTGVDDMLAEIKKRRLASKNKP
jgi:hypothetical protein